MSASGTMRPSEAFGWAWTDAASRAPAPARRQPDASGPGSTARSGLGPTAKATLGLAATGAVALFCGVMSACMAFALEAAEPIARLSAAAGTPVLWTGLPKLVVVLLGGFTTNFLWCAYLHARNGTAYQ